MSGDGGWRPILHFCSPALYFLDCLGLACCVGIPDGGCVFKGLVNKGFVRSFLCLLVADLEVVPEKALNAGAAVISVFDFFKFV